MVKSMAGQTLWLRLAFGHFTSCLLALRRSAMRHPLCHWVIFLFVVVVSSSSAIAGTPIPPPNRPRSALALAAQEPVPPVPQPPGPASAVPPSGPQQPTLPEVFGQDQVRLPLLAEPPGLLGATPKPSAAAREKFEQYVDKVVDPENTLDLIVGRPRVFVLKQIPFRFQLEETQIARFLPLFENENKQFSITGLRVGTTILNLWFGNPADPDSQTVLSFLVRVLPDPEARRRLERIYDALAAEINRLFPNSVVKLALAGDKVVISGQAKDIVEATQILRIVRANTLGQQTGAIPALNPAVPVSGVDPITGSAMPSGSTNVPGIGGAGTPTLENYLTAGGPNVINLLRIPGEQQVMLRVTVAEINRSAARAIGVDFTVLNQKGQVVFNNGTGRITNVTGGGTTGGAGTTFQGNNNLLALMDNGQVFAAISALRTLSFARTLAEPNLVTTNGQTASFQAGGRFPVPTITGATFTGLQGVAFVPFGVQLSFIPYITDKDRIRLIINSEVSVRDLQATTTIGSTAVPGINTRNFSTTVELREGQTLAVAGLIQNSFGGESDRVPFFGDLPLIGRFAAFDRSSYSEQELVVLVTPELVRPYDNPHQVPDLPGSDLFEPGDLEFYLLGRLESRRAIDYRSTVRTDIHRMIRYRHCEDIFIQGPHGHSDAQP
jgi:pilus assembly protein CpaC